MAGGKSAPTSPLAMRLRPYRTKDDVDEDEVLELGMLVDSLMLSCENVSKSKGVKRRFNSDSSKQLEVDTGNLFTLMHD